MGSLPMPTRRLTMRPLHAAGYVIAALACGLAGWFVARIPDSAFVPVTAALALAAATAIVIVNLRAHTLTSPAILIGVPLLLSLAGAMAPVTQIFGAWSPSTLAVAVLIVLAPLAGTGFAKLAAPDRTTPRLEPGTAAAPHPTRLIVICTAMCVAGTLVYGVEWSRVGGPPLLSENIDLARFGLAYGLAHVLTQGLPLALLIATWARVGRSASFTPAQRRALEAIICFVPVILLLGGARSLVVIPLVTTIVVVARYVSPHAARRMAVVIPLVLIALSSALFIARLSQSTPAGPVGSVLYNDTGKRTSVVQSTYRAISISLGQQLRVVAELRDADIRTPPFTTSIWFAHNLTSRAVDPHTITSANAGGWLTSTYAGQLLLDFGLLPAMLFGFVLGASAHVLYRRFARGRSVTIIWMYAYLAGPLALAFYLNVFLYFIFPVLDLIALAILSRILIRPQQPATETVHS